MRHSTPYSLIAKPRQTPGETSIIVSACGKAESCDAGISSPRSRNFAERNPGQKATAFPRATSPQLERSLARLDRR
jgi:hypothetical protein